MAGLLAGLLSMSAITVQNLGKAYKQYPTRWSRLAEWIDPRGKPRHQLHWVLKDINFSVSPGEAVGIIGVNGAGKSTLLKMITGTTQPTTGSVQINGRVAALLELGMGFHPDFTGRQNAYMAGQLLGYSVEEIAALMPEIEAFAEIGDYIDQPMRVYSSGMQVCLAFSVATMSRPDILIVDEALSVGDAYFQAKCYTRINQFKQDGTTLVLVSHSPGDVVKHCERAIFLKDGEIRLDASSRDATNIYLDELFGKCKARDAEEITAEIENRPSEIFYGEAENFHTRPGYRKEEYRWGQGGATILDYSIISEGQHYPPQIESNALTDFYFKTRFNADFDSIVPGLLIKTLEGIFLYGTNSFISSQNASPIPAKNGDLMVFRFSLPMSLNEGYYLVSFGVSSGDPQNELIPLDRRYDSVLIHVTRSLQFWGIVDLAAKFQLLKSAKAEG